MSTEDTPDGRSGPDNSLRNFTFGLLAVSAVVIVIMYLLQTSAG
ncbi:MAG: hypothetical protein WD080_08810 [Egibacteraceae bacterium]